MILSSKLRKIDLKTIKFGQIFSDYNNEDEQVKS